jgi:hypothetical protein
MSKTKLFKISVFFTLKHVYLNFKNRKNMKKNYLLLLLVAFTMSASAQFKVTFRVNMKNETISPNGVHVPGAYQKAAGMANDWVPGDAACEAKDPDNDKVYELQVSVPPGTYEYKFVNNNDWASGAEGVPSGCNVNGNRTFTVSTGDLVLDIVCFGSCTNCPATTYERDVTFMLIDSNSKFTDVKFKGAMSGWADFQGYDDGTHGDKTSGDHIYTAVYKTKEGEYEWGATNAGSWVIQGSNRKFTMDSKGVITGDTTYGIPKLGALIDLTFNVDMTNEIVASSGVYVAGNFMESLESPIGNWDKDTVKLQPRTAGSNIYTVKVKLHAGKFDYKFWNGVDKVNSDAPAENADFTAGGCGEPNGLGGHNRLTDLRGKTTAVVLPTYMFNSCNVSASISKIGTIAFGVKPNPAQSNITVNFKNNGNIEMINITDMNGRVVLSQNVSSSVVEINIETLTNGVYMVNAIGKDGSFGVQKLVKN